MKTLFISLCIVLMALGSRAQTSGDTIVVAPGPSGMYFYHIVRKGESLQSLSSEYGVQTGRLAKLNNYEQLKPYELIKIPLNKANIVQSGNTSSNASLTPLYHKVLKGETLFRVGKLYGDVPLSSLRSWNNLQGNTVDVGQYLVVGWLRKKPTVAAAQPTQATQPQQPPVTQNTTEETTSPAPEKSPSETSASSPEGNGFLREVIASERNRAKNGPQPMQTKASVAKPLLTETPSPAQQEKEKQQSLPHPLLSANGQQEKENNRMTEEQPVKETEKAPAQPPVQVEAATASTPTPDPVEKQTATKVVKTQADNSPAQSEGGTAETSNPFTKMLNQIAHRKAREKEETKQAPKPQPQPSPPLNNQQPTTITQNMPADTASSTQPVTSPLSLNENIKTDSAKLHLSRESAFYELYQAQTQGQKLVSSEKGAAGWFKSNVKPGSKKYYALCNDLPRGTIVKVINPINKKFVFVKVLAPIPTQKENYNLIIKLSDAAMNDLGTNQPRFWSKIVYPRLKAN